MSAGAADALPMIVAAMAATTHVRVACITVPFEFLKFISAPAESGVP
jgi:hypothetical protein